MKRYWFIFLLLFSKLHAETECSWLDLPNVGFEEIFQPPTDESCRLTEMVIKYHLVPKSSKEHLCERIEKLEAICVYLKQLYEVESFQGQKSTLQLLEAHTQKKINYLRALLEIPSDEEVISYHLDFSLLNDPRYIAMPLRNNGSYSLKMKEFWGNFWLESVDPCHRRLADYYRFWQSTSPQVSNYLSFFLWLETEPVPKYVPVVRYFTKDECEKRQVVVRDGCLMKVATGEFLTTSLQSRNLFVIDLQKRLFVETWGDGIWHTSLTAGKPVLGAGLLHAENGVIKRICFESGHYLPSLSQGYQAIKILLEQNASFVDPIEIIYFDKRNKYKARISPEDLQEEKKFMEEIFSESKRELLATSEF
jgi:hypothetical protein